jgi:hypothetical protein
MPTCRGFTFRGEDIDAVVEIFFKSTFEIPNKDKAADGWYSYERKGLYTKHKGVAANVPDILSEQMHVSKAQARCTAIPDCESFAYASYVGTSEPTEPVMIHFKGSADISHDEDDTTSDWVTFRRLRLYSQHNGHVSGRFPDIGAPEQITIQQAKMKCVTLPGCRGFTYELAQGFEQDPNWPVTIHFKSKVDVEHGDGSIRDRWVTHRRMGLFTKHKGFISGSHPDLLQSEMTVHAAHIKCLLMAECRGFTFKALANASNAVMIYFKSNADIDNSDGEDSPWTTYRRTGLYSHQRGHIHNSAADLLVAKMTRGEATAMCDSLHRCRGLTYARNMDNPEFTNDGEETSQLEVHFKDRADWHMFDEDSTWQSYHRDDLGFLFDGEDKLAPIATKREFLRKESQSVGEIIFESASQSEF